MVRGAGGKHVSRDMTKALVKSHVTTQVGRHGSTDAVPEGPKVGQGKPPEVGRHGSSDTTPAEPGQGKQPRKAAKVRAKM